MPTWTTPVDHVTGYVVTSTDWNNFFGANGDISYLYGDTAWTAVSVFTNSWTNFGGAFFNAAFRREGTRVKLRGIIKSGTINTIAFNLPANYRPASGILVSTVSNNAFGVIQIAATGDVTPTVGNNASVSLDNISFDILS